MSNNTNTLLFERAAEMVDYWPGTLYAELIEQDIRMGDLSALQYHVSQAEAEAAREDYHNEDIY